MKAFPRGFWIAGPAMALLYFLSSWAAYTLRLKSGVPPLFWFADGVALAGLMLGGLVLWPWLAVGALAFNALRGVPLITFSLTASTTSVPLFRGPLMTIGNVAGPVLGAWLLRKYSDHSHDQSREPASLFRTIRGTLEFTFLSAGVATFIGAGLENLGISLAHQIDPSSLIVNWMEWWLNQAGGVILVAPAILLFHEGWTKRKNIWDLDWDWQIPVIFGTILTIGLFSYTHVLSLERTLLIRPYLLYPFVIWAAFRSGLPGANFAMLITASCVIFGHLHGVLPELYGRNKFEALLLQEALLLTLSITGMLVAAAVREKHDAVKARDNFLSLASHELKTPLTSLSIQAQMRKRKQQMGDTEYFTRERMDAIWLDEERQIRRLVHLVENMFDVSRLSTEHLKLAKKPTDLRAVVDNVVSSLAPLLASAGCEISVIGTDTDAIMGSWDSARLEQALSNLIANAATYGKGKPVRIVIERSGNSGTIRVSDQGIGIADQDQIRIFEPYERAVDSSDFSGLGLGLYMTKLIVNAHQGKLSVQSQVGKGSEFIVELPLV